MRRRRFLELMAAAAAAVRSPVLRAAHHQLSADPLVVEFDFDGQIQPVTSLEDFMIYDHFSLPVLPPPARLRVDGEVAEPVEIGIERLGLLPGARVTAVLESAGNGAGPRGLISNGVWEGWRLADVLRLVAPARAAAWVNFYGAEGYVRSVPLERVLRSGLLVDRLNGRPLDKAHGLPYRAALPGWYGMDWVKWLNRIELVRLPRPSAAGDYLELLQGPGGKTLRRQLPPVQVKSVIVLPQKGSILKAGSVELSGVAWSGNGISRVEASADGGSTWHEAQLDAGEIYSWRVWRATLDVPGQGLVTFACRATDSQGIAQPASRDPARLDYFGLNEIQRISCLVV